MLLNNQRRPEHPPSRRCLAPIRSGSNGRGNPRLGTPRPPHQNFTPTSPPKVTGFDQLAPMPKFPYSTAVKYRLFVTLSP